MQLAERSLKLANEKKSGYQQNSLTTMLHAFIDMLKAAADRKSLRPKLERRCLDALCDLITCCQFDWFSLNYLASMLDQNFRVSVAPPIRLLSTAEANSRTASRSSSTLFDLSDTDSDDEGAAQPVASHQQP